MEDIKNHTDFLRNIVYLPKAKAKAEIQKATDKEIVLLIELILNFEQVSETSCEKIIKRKVSALQKLKWKLKTARGHLIKNIEVVRSVVSVAIVFMINSEVCEIF